MFSFILLFSNPSRDAKTSSILDPSHAGTLDNPYQNPAAAAAILAMHQSPPPHGVHHSQHYNYLQAQEQIHSSSLAHASNQYGAIHPSLPHMPTAQDYVTAAARRLNEQIHASRNLTEEKANRKRSISPSDSMKFKSPEVDFSRIMQHSSPDQAAASFHLLAAAASGSLANGSPTASGSYGNLSIAAAANAAATSNHFQQLQAHILRSSPYLQSKYFIINPMCNANN